MNVRSKVHVIGQYNEDFDWSWCASWIFSQPIAFQLCARGPVVRVPYLCAIGASYVDDLAVMQTHWKNALLH